MTLRPTSWEIILGFGISSFVVLLLRVAPLRGPVDCMACNCYFVKSIYTEKRWGFLCCWVPVSRWRLLYSGEYVVSPYRRTRCSSSVVAYEVLCSFA